MQTRRMPYQLETLVLHMERLRGCEGTTLFKSPSGAPQNGLAEGGTRSDGKLPARTFVLICGTNVTQIFDLYDKRASSFDEEIPLMKRLLLVAIALVAAFAVRPAMSADLPMAPVYKTPPAIVPVYSWTGCYLGGNVGTGWSSWTYSNPTDNPTVPGERGTILGNNVVAGGQVGCDYQGGAYSAFRGWATGPR